MKFLPKENQVLLIITIVLGLIDFFSIPFYSLLVTAVFGIVLFAVSKSLFLLALVFMTPLLIQLINRILGVKQGFANPTEIANRLKEIKGKYSQGENLNPETPTKEYFTDLLEVSKRVEDINSKNKQPKVKEVSAIVDTSLPTGPLVQGLNATPAFMEQFENLGTNIETNTRIYTPSESTVPTVGTIDKYPVQHPAIEKLDDAGVNTALMRTTTNNNLTLKGVDINASPV